MLQKMIDHWTRFKARFATPPPAPPLPVNAGLVLLCRQAVDEVRERLEGKYNPLAAGIVYISTSYPNIEDLINHLQFIVNVLKATDGRLSTADFQRDFNPITLDSFFISREGKYIGEDRISDFVIISDTLLDLVEPLSLVSAGRAEYHYRMLLKTLNSLISIHKALASVLAHN